jgi:hypothetical protein
VFKEGIAKFLKLDSLMENVTGYVETRIEILKYDLKEDLSRALSKISVFAIILLSALFFLFFISAGIALEIATHLGYFAGFGIVGGIYVLTAVVIYAQRVSISKKFEQQIKEVIKQTKK